MNKAEFRIYNREWMRAYRKKHRNPFGRGHCKHCGILLVFVDLANHKSCPGHAEFHAQNDKVAENNHNMENV